MALGDILPAIQLEAVSDRIDTDTRNDCPTGASVIYKKTFKGQVLESAEGHEAIEARCAELPIVASCIGLN